MEAQQTPLRTAIMRIMSDMLDNSDGHGIYETGRFMDRIEQLLCDMMVAPEVLELSGSEAVFGLMAWLTTRDETTVLGPRQDVDISIIERFIAANNLKEPRDAWSELLTHPKELGPEPVSEDSASEESVVKECVFPPFHIELSGFEVDPSEEIKPIPERKAKINRAVVVEGSIEQIVEFIVRNGLHKKPE